MVTVSHNLEELFPVMNLQDKFINSMIQIQKTGLQKE